MELFANLLWLPWTVCVALLLAGFFLKRAGLNFWGDVMLSISFGLSSLAFFILGHIWMGIAFAFPALRQAYVLVAARNYLNGPKEPTQ